MTMDSQTQHLLLTLIRNQRVAAFGTLRGGAPEVSLVPFAATIDCTAFYIHISRLAHHTQNILQDARVSLLLSEVDDASRNPSSLARVSIQADAVLVETDSPEYNDARSTYLTKFPQSEMMFGLGDFGLYKIVPRTARFVAGFAQTFNLTLNDFREAGLAQLH
jgi:putative heme iron utilization protein